MQKQIRNRKGLRIVVEVEGELRSQKLVFVTHGLSGSREQAHIKGIREAFASEGYVVVSFDATGGFGESEGDSVNATATSYLEDLEDVIAWAGTQAWYVEPFVLAGHSLGSAASLAYAAKHPDKINALFPMSAGVTWESWYAAQDKDFLRAWKEKGYYFKESTSLPGKSGRIGYGLVEDLLRYSVLESAKNIECPVLLLVGEKDTETTPEMNGVLYEQLGGPKQLLVIDGMEHNPRTPAEIGQMQDIIRNWIRNTLTP